MSGELRQPTEEKMADVTARIAVIERAFSSCS
jgi:hypothetical protein